MLCSWKEIAGYINRDIRTCSRWAKELELPVHKYQVDSKFSRVWAQKSEIDNWLDERKNNENNHVVRSKARKLELILVSIFALLAVLFAFLYFKSKSSVPDNKLITIAVLPFQEQDSSGQDEYLNDGLSEDIARYIAAHENFKVIPVYSIPDSNNWIKNTKLSLKEMGADYVLKGTALKNNDKIELRFKLENANNAGTILDARYDEELRNSHIIKESLLKEICNRLEIRFSRFGNSALNINNNDSYELYLKANYIMSKISSGNNDKWQLYHKGNYYSGLINEESNEIAKQIFTEAIDLDPNFAPAYIGLAQCFANHINLGWDQKLFWLDKAEDLLKKAQSISPDLPDYFYTLIKVKLLQYISFNQGDLDTPIEMAKKSIVKFPEHLKLNLITAYCYYSLYGLTGDESIYKQAFKYQEKAFTINPFYISNFFYVELLMLDKQFDKAIEICSFLCELNDSYLIKLRLGEIYYYAGELDKSEAIFNKCASVKTKAYTYLYYLGMIAAKRGDTESALQLIDKVKNITDAKGTNMFKLASIYFRIGMNDEGYEYLDSVFSIKNILERKYIFKKYIEVDSSFDQEFDNICRKYFEQEN